MKVKVKGLGASKVAMRRNGACPRGARHLKGRKGCWRTRAKRK